MRLIVAASAVLLLGGCATEPVALHSAQVAPAYRVFWRAPADATATLTVVRDRGAVGSACYAGLYLNGAKAAYLERGEKVDLRLPAGETLVGVVLAGSGLCGMGRHAPREREVRLLPYQQKAYRIFTDANAVMDVLPTSY